MVFVSSRRLGERQAVAAPEVPPAPTNAVEEYRFLIQYNPTENPRLYLELS